MSFFDTILTNAAKEFDETSGRAQLASRPNGPLSHILLKLHPEWGMPVVPTTPTPTPTTTPAPTAEETAAQRNAIIAKEREKASHQAELYLRSIGVDPTAYMPRFNQELDRVQGYSLPTDDPSKMFDNSIIEKLVEGDRASLYQGARNQAQSQFGEGFEKRDITSSLLDDTINSILEGQRKSALDYLDRGKARGIYNDVGYNAGLAALNNSDTSGRAELSSLGNTVLDKYRSQADTLRDRAFGSISNIDVGDNFSLEPYINEYQGILGDASSHAGGDLRNLLGGRNFFDFSKLSGSAGTAQGALNLRDADVATALAERKRRNEMSRGLGSQGAF